MTTPASRVHEEMGRFLKALPALLLKLRGKWVVFKDGEVKSIHTSEDEAFLAGREAFGSQGGHVIAEVAEVHAVPVTAAVMFAGC